MKVAILTYSKAYNRGAILQAYALQKAINKLGATCHQIDYNPDGVKKQYSFIVPKTFVDIKRDVAFLLGIKGRKKLDSFRKKISFTEMCAKEKLGKLNKEYDTFIVGSDQVWNKICTESDYSFFLNFVTDSKKKNSYAASFGSVSLSQKEKNIYSQYLSKFNNISVRETSGIAMVRELIQRDVEVVLDPVFLLEKKEWEDNSYCLNGHYIFLFQYVSNIDTIIKASEIAKSKGWELYISSSHLSARKYGKVIRNFGIEDFLSYIRNAELVITDSFHCTAFSIIFNKMFYCVFREGDPANTRLESILNLFQIENRVFNETNILLDKEIDYQKVNYSIQREKQKSYAYLKKILEEQK